MTFDDIEESADITHEVHRQLFHTFILYGKTILYPKYVHYPKTSADAQIHMKEFNVDSMNSEVALIYTLHVIIEKCSHRLKEKNLGGKSQLTCRAFNSATKHRRGILHSTFGHLVRWNNKIIILFDRFKKELNSKKILQYNTFTLFQRDSDVLIQELTYHGACILVENIYLQWSINIPLYKITVHYIETRWYE